MSLYLGDRTLRLGEVIAFLREPKRCDCDQREKNKRLPKGERTHRGDCASWPDNEYTLEQVADMLDKRFGGDL